MAKKRSFRPGLNSLISWGASVVIIGLMFKILHWEGGEIMIAAGLITEAFLFLIMGFKSDPWEPDWTRVYPELDEDGEPRTVSAKTQIAAAPSTAALDKMMADAKIGPELIESLGSGLRTFGDKVSAISNVSDASIATNEYTEKLRRASSSYDSLSTAFDKASSSLSEMANSNVDTKAYHDQVNGLVRNLSALNAVYELELQDSTAHLKSMNKFYQNLSDTMQNFNESMEDSKQFKDEVAKLARNLSSLNSIYGNMLSAMNQPRVN